MQLKVNLHTHSQEDKKEKNIEYNLYQLIDFAKNLNFNVLAITFHNKLFIPDTKLQNYAQKNDILLIQGIEKNIEHSHVVILNTNQEIEKIKTFTELKEFKKHNPEIFVLAPHPFYFLESLNKNLEKNIEIFDAIENSYFYHKSFNFFNQKAYKLAKKYNLPFISTSDTHFLKNLNKNYIIVESEKKEPKTIFQAIKNFKFKNYSQPSTLKELINDLLKLNFANF